MNFDTIIIGAGLSGLAAARTLTEYGRDNYLVLEKSKNIGGRVNTIEVDGYRLDLGFQVGLSSYPAFHSVLPIQELEPCYFGSGALVEEKPGRFRCLANPLFHPSKIASGILTHLPISDRVRLMGLVAECLMKTDQTLLEPGNLSTTEFLQKRGFSEKIIKAFFRPFFGGVFLDDKLETDSSLFCYYLSKFATGRAFFPKGGAGAMSQALANPIPKDNIQFDSEVTSITANDSGVEIKLAGASGSLSAKKLILAADPATSARWLNLPKPEYRSTKVVYLSSPQSLYKGPWIVLPSDPARITQHFVQSTNIDPTLAPTGKHLISATVVKQTNLSDEQLAKEVTHEIRHTYPETAKDLQPIRVVNVPKALPIQSPENRAAWQSEANLPKNTFLAGDLTNNASLQNALASGRESALQASLNGAAM